MDEQENGIDLERLDHLQPAEPTFGFADRVVERWLWERGAVRRRSPRRLEVAVLAALVAGVLLVGWVATRPGDHVSGSLVASSRESIALGERATIVAEAGAEIDWRVEPDGRALIEQRAGRVFYRVEDGGAFEVATPAGTIRVTGTCFTVEVEPMTRRKVALVGTGVAALSAAIVVAVYEGGVVVAHDGVEIAAGPGERVVSDAERGVRRISAEAGDDAVARPANDLARELQELRSRTSAVESQNDRLRAQVESLGGKPDDVSPQDRAHRCATHLADTPGCSWIDPDADTLREMARCASLRVDHPVFLVKADASTRPPDEWITHAGLSAAEADELDEAGEQFRQKHDAALVGLYVEAGGSPDLAEDQPPPVLAGMIEALLDATELEAAQRRLAQERAGLVEVPSDLSTLPVADRLLREVYGTGDGYATVVAKVLGPERAHELRSLNDGWGASWGAVGDCEQE